MTIIKSNSSGKTLLKYFMEKYAETGGRYYPVVPWDARNLDEQREFYEPKFLGELIDLYFRRERSNRSVKDFIFKIPTLAEILEEDIKSRKEYERLKEETRNRMKEMGYEV